MSMRLLSTEQELLELKQLYEKATGDAYGPPPSSGKSKGKKKSAGGRGQEKQVDTKKADKEAKRVSYSTTHVWCRSHIFAFAYIYFLLFSRNLEMCWISCSSIGSLFGLHDHLPMPNTRCTHRTTTNPRSPCICASVLKKGRA